MSYNKKTVRSDVLGESFARIAHSSGLTVLLYPMPGFTTSYAVLATEYGSVDNCFKLAGDADFTRVPDGIAHFLEHKMFEDEDGDAFAEYARTGASANAYTSFDRTAYLFSCSDNFEASLKILLSFVTGPYFTPDTVEKEKGIIGQEIQMYDDSPDWQVFFGMLGAVYKNHPIKADIAGTVESIAQIDADLLYRCYNTFYNLNNMVLAVAGSFDEAAVLALCDEVLKPAPQQTILREQVDEPRDVAQKNVERQLPVAMPLFHIGLKGVPGGARKNFFDQIMDEVLLDIIAGDASPLYRRLYDSGLINPSFSTEVLCGRDYICRIFSGESPDPVAVQAAIFDEIARVQRDGINERMFTIVRKATYGRYFSMYSRADAVAGLMLLAHFAGSDAFEVMQALKDLTKGQLEARLRDSFVAEHSALSVVRPLD